MIGKAAVVLVACWLAPSAHAEPMKVVLVKRAGVTAYEEVAEEFGERCRVRARIISFGDEGWRGSGFGSDELVVTVGQEALDAVRRTHARVIPTLAFHVPSGLVGPPATPHPELILRLLTLARPQKIHLVGAVYGPRSEALLKQAARAAERVGATLISMRVADGPEAVRALHALAAQVDALWLPGDTDVVTPQVFQYALRLQLERGMPVAAATRQQVHSGALLAADFSPRASGRIAAELANRYLDGSDEVDTSDLDLYRGARVIVNSAVARRLSIDVPALMRLGARLE